MTGNLREQIIKNPVGLVWFIILLEVLYHLVLLGSIVILILGYAVWENSAYIVVAYLLLSAALALREMTFAALNVVHSLHRCSDTITGETQANVAVQVENPEA